MTFCPVAGSRSQRSVEMWDWTDVGPVGYGSSWLHYEEGSLGPRTTDSCTLCTHKYFRPQPWHQNETNPLEYFCIEPIEHLLTPRREEQTRSRQTRGAKAEEHTWTDPGSRDGILFPTVVERVKKRLSLVARSPGSPESQCPIWNLVPRAQAHCVHGVPNPNPRDPQSAFLKTCQEAEKQRIFRTKC